MSCNFVQDLISPFLDGKLPVQEREKMSAHVKSCRHCGSSFETARNLRSSMRSMRQTPVPPRLTAQLRVMASHARQQNAARATLGGRLRLWLAPVQLLFDNMMRPMALPFAGGLFSALVAFGVLVPNLMFQHGFGDTELFTSPDGEVVVLSSNGTYFPGGSDIDASRRNTEPENILRIDRVDVATADDANVVVLDIDPNGRVADWTVAQGILTPDLQSIIMLSYFKPATFLGIPMSSKVKAVQRVGGAVRSRRS
jgi:hypothetical protein